MFEGLFSPLHLIIILGIALIIFGPGKIPELGKSLGKALNSFKKAMNDLEKKPDDIKNDKTDENKPS
jgi:sec-independent protein translocase protein TatA